MSAPTSLPAPASKPTAMAAEIRTAVADDLAAIRACTETSYARYVPRIGKRPAPMDRDYTALIAGGHVHVIAAEDRFAGFVTCFPLNGFMHIDALAVLPDRRGAGLGAKLIAHAEDLARAAGLPGLELYTNAKMVENLAYYPAQGFTETERRHEDGFDRVYYRKLLQGRVRR